MADNASLAQYATPTSHTCVSCLHVPPTHHPLPTTGYALGAPLLVGVSLIALGTLLRGALRA